MLFGSGLREPNVTTIAVEVAARQSICDILLDDDGASGGIDEPCACNLLTILTVVLWLTLTLLHLRDEILVEQTSCLLMQRAVDCDNITLTQHLLEILDAPAANLFLDLGLQRLVVEIE